MIKPDQKGAVLQQAAGEVDPPAVGLLVEGAILAHDMSDQHLLQPHQHFQSLCHGKERVCGELYAFSIAEAGRDVLVGHHVPIERLHRLAEERDAIRLRQ
ncbi:hypothetical protein D3C71_1780460 [compost metagenome]